MSSFVIPKSSYIKVAGLMTGIAMGDNVWLYDYEHNRNMIGEDYHRKLTTCYELNVDSVCKQYAHDGEEGGYGNPATYIDDSDYMSVFNKYMTFGRRIADNKQELLNALKELRYFSRSVGYQIEDDCDHAIVMEFFNSMVAALVDLIDRGVERNCWGEFNFAD